MEVDSITVLTLRLSEVVLLTQAHLIGCSIRLTREFKETISTDLPSSISTHPPTRVSGESQNLLTHHHRPMAAVA